jgi:hypothetical protein
VFFMEFFKWIGSQTSRDIKRCQDPHSNIFA